MLYLLPFLAAAVALRPAASDAQVILPEQIRRPVEVEDVLNWREITEVRISPDGCWVAYVVSEAQEEKNTRTGDVWLVSTSQPRSSPVRVTRHPADDSQIAWSPDSRRLAFLSTREDEDDEKAQIFLYSLNGGEPQRLTDHDTGVSDPAWSPDGRTLYFLAEDPLPKEAQERLDKQEQDDAEPVEQRFQFAHLWTLDLKTRDTRRITSGKFHVFEFRVAPNGESLAFAAAPTPLLNYDQEIEIYTVSPVGGPRRRLTRNDAPESQIRWSPDGEWITCVTAATAKGEVEYVAPPRLFAVPADGGKLSPLMGDVEQGLVQELCPHFWAADGRSIFLPLDVGVTHQLVELAVQEENGRLVPGKRKMHYAGERLFNLLDAGRDTTHVACTLEGPSASRDVHLADLADFASARRLTRLHAELPSLALARSEVVRWKSRDGQQVEGLLYYPLDYKQGKRVPLLVNIHGGPLAADKNAFLMDWWTYPHLAASHGYAELYVNYRGSTGYGDKFARAIAGAYYTKDVEDILAGVDWLVERGIADPQRLGIHGWSNGGILTTWITTETGRFKAAAVGAADVNWISDFGNADIAVPFDIAYFRGRPWENLKHYLKKSPLFRLDRVTTPTLILHGAEDVRVPTGQGHEHFRALKEHGRADVEMVLFPREEHDLLELAHQRTKIEKELAWFDKHLLDRDEPPQRVAAPLRKRVAQSGGLYGEMRGGVLVPETVIFSGDSDKKFEATPLAVGRFEVTNAQYQFFLAGEPDVPTPRATKPWKSFDVWDANTRRFRAGYANHPVAGMSAHEARRYCDWLSAKTGRQYRLPTADEWRRLARTGEPDDGEFPWGSEYESGRAVCVSHWAEKTVFDAEPFFRSDEGKSLLKRRLPTEQAGTLDADELHRYDISGNVWEWCTTKRGATAHGGGWSSTPAELRLQAQLDVSPDSRRSDVGFRVVEELE